MSDIEKLISVIRSSGLTSSVIRNNGDKLIIADYLLMSDVANLVVRNFETLCVRTNNPSSTVTVITEIKNTPKGMRAMFSCASACGPIDDHEVVIFVDGKLKRAKVVKK